MPEAHDIAYFEAKARQCFRIADSCSNEELARQIRQFGYEFVAKAVELGADPAYTPRPRDAPFTEA